MAAILFLGEELKDKYAKLYLRKLGYEILDYFIQNKIIDYIVLPLDGIKKDEIFENLVKNNIDKTYFVYEITPFMWEIKTKYNLKFIELKKDKEFNNILNITRSEALLMYSIEILPITLKDAKILIIGTNESINIIANDFKKYVNNVLVAINKETNNDFNVNNIKTIKISELNENINNYDLIINTFPSLVIDENILRNVSPSSYILDLAPFPGGIDYYKAKQFGIYAFSLEDICQKISPKSIGIEYAKAINRGIEKWKN